ncbi:FAD-dependent oxidoreductase [Streptomyces boluensis]|uniref:FAD-binding protein n=1 Tax=Streptomyces boluensis TaxID=1775135 RepID=A0A964UJT5_9ACTN|nr:FAD-dependent monooxygenase [Streptomyces boluensis]NBE49962.1 FAD-binding protein [Streptomyces boluensis]
MSEQPLPAQPLSVEPSRPRPRSVVVAGGGIGGLAAAAALAHDGARVTVVERMPYVRDAGGGLLLHPNGVRAADAISAALGARIRAHGHVTGEHEVRRIIDAQGAVLAEERIGSPFGAPQVPILRTALQTALLVEAAAAGAVVFLGTGVEGFTEHRDHIRVHLSDGTSLTGDALVAADGINSATRTALLDDGPPDYRGYTSVRGRTTAAGLGQRPYVANGRGVQLFVAPVGRDTLYWTAKITAPPGLWPAKGPMGALRDLLAALSGWDESVVRLVRDCDPANLVVTDVHDRDPAPRMAIGRVALLGDAAHPMVPALGQGANTALEDAVVLAAALRTHTDVERALAAYESERLPRTAEIQRRSRRQGSLDQGADDAAERARNDLMRRQGRKDAEALDITAWTPPTTTTEEVPVLSRARKRRNPMPAAAFTAHPSTPGPVWRDANVRSGPSLSSPVLRLLLPDPDVAHDAEGWTVGDEVIEGEHQGGEITSSLWFRLSDGGWCSAVNFEPDTVAALVSRTATEQAA